MSLSFVALCLWVVTAAGLAMFPSRDHHWRLAYVLIAVGIPLLGWLTYENGPVMGFIGLAVGISVLRWPVYYLGRWALKKSRLRR